MARKAARNRIVTKSTLRANQSPSFCADPQEYSGIPKDSDHLQRTLEDFVSDRIHRYESSRDLRRTGKRWRFSFKRLRAVMHFNPEDFDDDEQYAIWLDDVFFPTMVDLRINQGKKLAALRENVSHLGSWMAAFGVADIIVSRFRTYTRATGRLWRDLVDEGGSRSDEAPRLSVEDVKHMLAMSDKLLENPSKLLSTQMKYSNGNWRKANMNHIINIHAAIRIALLTTKRPAEILSIKRSCVSEETIVVECKKVHRNGKMTEYVMWSEIWPSVKRLLEHHDKDSLFSLNRTSMLSWIKAFMVYCGHEQEWFNLHRMRSFSGDILAAAGANSGEMKAHGDWKSDSAVDTYIGELGRKAQVKAASEKKHRYLVQQGILEGHVPDDRENLLDLIAGLNVWEDPPEWIPLMDELSENLQLSTSMVDVPRFELGASTMPR